MPNNEKKGEGRMSFLIKALKKANQEQSNIKTSGEHEKVDQNVPSPAFDRAHAHGGSRPFDLQLVFTGMLILLVGVGIYFNYNISSNIISTKNGMAVISDNFRAQEQNFEQMHKLIVQMDNANNGQSKEFLAKIDTLSVSVASQIDEIQKLSKSQYTELSKTIEEQEKSISILSAKYEQLEKSVRNYSDVNSSYTEQLNALKKKLAEINSAQPQQ